MVAVAAPTVATVTAGLVVVSEGPGAAARGMVVAGPPSAVAVVVATVAVAGVAEALVRRVPVAVVVARVAW
jgi:hypothetical protein